MRTIGKHQAIVTTCRYPAE